ncbi:unnamed protein product [Brachionus calyciflorus]|uniref:Uncharacterized protein n=1 Tax=Brachionus calyciflorus TaxID=104777 RepID=A0A814CR28_9BILA|nr:unnamed protein product [Brachionus calyciflorus]
MVEGEVDLEDDDWLDNRRAIAVFKRKKCKPNEKRAEQVNFDVASGQAGEQEAERLNEISLNETILNNQDGRQLNVTILDNTVYETPGGKVNKKIIQCEFCDFTSTNPGAVG